MKFKKNFKKGFTLVELIVVIAIVAILAAVSVVSYVAFIKQANESADIQLVKQLNIALQADQALHDVRSTPTEMLGAMEENGFIIENLTKTKSGYDIVWDQKNNRFALLKGEESIYAESSFDNSTQLLRSQITKLVDNSNEASDATDRHYAIYLTKEFGDADVLDIQGGLDVGVNKVGIINYENNDEQTVTIRTNSQFTNLNVNAPADTVYHYGVGRDLEITDIADESFHERGSWRSIVLESGKLEIEEGSFVGGLEKNGGKLINDGVIATEITGSAATTDVSGTGTNGLEENSVIKVGNAETFANLAFAQSTGVFGDSALNIELTANIDLSDKTWVPFGAEVEAPGTTYSFSGTIDGKEFHVIGLNNGDYRGKISQNHSTTTIGQLYGFIATVKGDVFVKNITFEAVKINDSLGKVTAAVISDTKGAETVKLLNVDVINGSVTGLDKVGGLVGYAQNAKLLIQNCSVNAELAATVETDSDRVGGLIGYIGDGGTVSIFDTSVAGKVIGSKDNGWYGSIAGGLTANAQTGLKVEKFETSAEVKVSTEASRRVLGTSNEVLVGLNSLTGNSPSHHDVNVDAYAGFTLVLSGENPTFLDRIIG